MVLFVFTKCILDVKSNISMINHVSKSQSLLKENFRSVYSYSCDILHTVVTKLYLWINMQNMSRDRKMLGRINCYRKTLIYSNKIKYKQFYYWFYPNYLILEVCNFLWVIGVSFTTVCAIVWLTS